MPSPRAGGVEPPRRGRALAADAQLAMVRRRRRRRPAVDRVALRRLRLLAASRPRTDPRQPGDMPSVWWTHAGICARHAPHPELRTRSACFLAGDAGHGFLRRRRGAGAGPRIAALAKRAMVGERSTSLRPTPPDRSRGPGSKAGDCVGPGAQGPRCSA